MSNRLNNTTDQENKTISQKQLFQLMGEMTLVLMGSAEHRFLFVSELDWLLVPPIYLEQYKILRQEDGTPIGFIVWALVNEEVDQRLSAGFTRLMPHEWRSGTQAWLVESIFLEGQKKAQLEYLKDEVFRDIDVKMRKRLKNGAIIVDTL